MNFSSTTELNETASNLTLIELLDSLQYTMLGIISYQTVMPIVGLLGIVLNGMSAWIFFNKKKFSGIIHDYYRLLTIIYIIDMVLSIPYGVCFTPLYFPDMNSYACAIVQSVYLPLAVFDFHLIGAIEVC